MFDLLRERQRFVDASQCAVRAQRLRLELRQQRLENPTALSIP